MGLCVPAPPSPRALRVPRPPRLGAPEAQLLQALSSPWPRRATMDALPASPEPLLVVPQPEVLEELQQAQLGPLPRLAAICRLKRLPSGGYSTTDDLHLVLERRRVANAKERERVRCQGRLTPAIMLAGVPHPTPVQSLGSPQG